MNPKTQWKVDYNVNTHMNNNEEDLYNVQHNPTLTQQVLIGHSFQQYSPRFGKMKVNINGIPTEIRNVYYFPALQNKLFSLRAIQAKGAMIHWKLEELRIQHTSGQTTNIPYSYINSAPTLNLPPVSLQQHNNTPQPTQTIIFTTSTAMPMRSQQEEDNDITV